MPTLELDTDVVEAVKDRALPWVDRSPSDTLRRLLRIEPAANSSQRQPASAAATHEAPLLPERPNGRAPKADLRQLIAAGFLSEGETLKLKDYSGNIIAGVQAEARASNKLIWNGRLYSMSKLAAAQLKKAGYSGHSVRGPAHWVTANGDSVLELWNRYERRAG